ncbi:MAG TPA: MaoC/PaaZ C-terminal domain-containing protein [Acidimicrobiia bacterium]|nr:MaoC/PaaZ C-terminal domain-containing protein [Acidimicrobiia bacterium]
MPPAHQAPRDSLAIEQFEGREYGPYPLQICREKVDEFVAATGDEPKRWVSYAPPGWAAAALFAVAPALLEDPGVASAPVIHGEQRFTWTGALVVESILEVSGRVSRVRERGGVHFLTFEIEATGGGGPLISGSSLFLVGGDSPPAVEVGEHAEPGPSEASPNDSLLRQTSGLTSLRRSASRSDLVRYAAATRDWNPVHWDHQAAVNAGLGGVVVHGLLQAAWLMSAASSLRDRPDSLAEAKFRFRTPLSAAAPAVVSGVLDGEQLEMSLDGNGHQFVSGRIILR